MPTDRLARFRSWPSGVYNDELAKLWRDEHPRRAAVVRMPIGSASSPSHKLALVCHVFYTDLLEEVGAALASLPPSTDVFVSVVDDEARAAVIDRIGGAVSGKLDVRVVPNRGRDIAPKYVTFSDVCTGSYEAILFLHTKKSTYEHVGTPWRRYLFDSLAGSNERVEQILAVFEDNPRLGVLAPQHFGAVAADTTWQGTFVQASRLARRMGVRVQRWSPPDFASGSMFWARPQALAAMVGLHLRMSDFPPEARQVTATNMHALERLLFVAAERSGYEAAMIPQTDSSGPAAAVIDDAGQPPLSTWLRALPPTVARMLTDLEIRRKRFSPVRHLTRLVELQRGARRAV